MHEKKLMDEALEELCGAKKYIKCAAKYRSTHPTWARKYYEMAQDEMHHADNLYNMAAGEQTAHTELESAYLDDQRDEYTECVAHVRAMIDAYKEG